MYSLELLGQQNVRWATTGLFLGYGVVAGWAGVWHMRRTAQPLIQFDALKQRTFAVVIWGGSLFRLAISVSPFLLPLMFQIAFGLSAFQSGLLVLAMFAGNLFMKAATTPILRRFGFRRILIVNGLITAALIASFTLLSPNTPTALLIVLLFAHGLSRSMQFTSISTLAFVDVPQSQMSSANSFFTVMTQMSMGMGVAVGAVTLRLAAWLRGGPSSSPTIADFHLAFGMVSIVAVLAVVDCLGLDRNAGAEVSGHTRS
jgi:Na+/melibiose symporter-like transporter